MEAEIYLVSDLEIIVFFCGKGIMFGVSEESGLTDRMLRSKFAHLAGGVCGNVLPQLDRSSTQEWLEFPLRAEGGVKTLGRFSTSFQ